MKKSLLILFLFQVVFPQSPDLFSTANAISFFIHDGPKKYFIEIYLRNGKFIQDSASLCTDLYYGNDYLKLNDNKILPKETDSIKFNSVLGIPRGGTWIWKVISGKLNLFVYDPRKNINAYKFIQKSDSILPFSNQSLEKCMFDNQESMKLIRNYKIGNTIMISTMFGGLIVFGSTILIEQKYRAIPISIGLCSISVSIISYFVSKNNRKKAIIIYNKT
jgi:hypothetical protein